MQEFPATLRDWRQRRRLSQLQLALEADVSARHVAFLETGRSRPSRAMILRLAGALEVPLGARNAMLNAAGFAPHYPELSLDAKGMEQVLAAMDWTIRRHAPYPAVVMDRLWCLVALNATAARMFAPLGLGRGASLLELVAAPGSAAHFIENWGEVGHHMMIRLRAESARAGGIAELDHAVAVLADDPAVAAYQPPDRSPPVVPTIYRAGGLRLSLFSTYAHFGTGEEVTLSGMKIELMFPADAATEAALRALQPDGD